MRVFVKIAVVAGLAGLTGLGAGGCSPVKGPRFWWDDQKRETLPDSYTLPDWPAANPVPKDPEPYVPKELPQDEIKRATTQQQMLIERGIPKVNAKDPMKEFVKVPVAPLKKEDDGAEEKPAKSGTAAPSEAAAKEKEATPAAKPESGKQAAPSGGEQAPF